MSHLITASAMMMAGNINNRTCEEVWHSRQVVLIEKDNVHFRHGSTMAACHRIILPKSGQPDRVKGFELRRANAARLDLPVRDSTRTWTSCLPRGTMAHITAGRSAMTKGRGRHSACRSASSHHYVYAL